MERRNIFLPQQASANAFEATQRQMPAQAQVPQQVPQQAVPANLPDQARAYGVRGTQPSQQYGNPQVPVQTQQAQAQFPTPQGQGPWGDAGFDTWLMGILARGLAQSRGRAGGGRWS